MDKAKLTSSMHCIPPRFDVLMYRTSLEHFPYLRLSYTFPKQRNLTFIRV